MERVHLTFKAVVWGLGLFGCAALLFNTMILADNYKCQQRWEASGMAAKLIMPSGCMVHVRGGWVPEKAVVIQVISP